MNVVATKQQQLESTQHQLISHPCFAGGGGTGIPLKEAWSILTIKGVSVVVGYAVIRVDCRAVRTPGCNSSSSSKLSIYNSCS